MAHLKIRLVCNECYKPLEFEIVEGYSEDVVYVEPCKTCMQEAAQQSVQPDEGYAPLEDHDPTADIERISKEGFPKSLRC